MASVFDWFTGIIGEIAGFFSPNARRLVNSWTKSDAERLLKEVSSKKAKLSGEQLKVANNIESILKTMANSSMSPSMQRSLGNQVSELQKQYKNQQVLAAKQIRVDSALDAANEAITGDAPVVTAEKKINTLLSGYEEPII